MRRSWFESMRGSQLFLQPGFAQPEQKAGAVRRFRKRRVELDMGGREIGLERERMGERLLSLIGPPQEPERHGHQPPGPGMMRVERGCGAADLDRLFVSFQREQRHVAHGRCIDRNERIARAKPLRQFKGLQPAFRLPAACQGIAEPSMGEREVRIELDRLRQMCHRLPRTATSGVPKPEHEMSPRLLVVELDGAGADGQRLVGEFADRSACIDIEHAHIGPAKQRMGMGIVGIERDRLLQQLLRLPLLVGTHPPHVRQRLHDQIPGVDVLRRFPANARHLGSQDLRAHRADDPVGDVVLQLEHVGQRAVVSFRPQVNPIGGIDQLAGDSNLVGGFAHAALEHVAHAQFVRDLADVDRLTLVGKGRIAGDDEEPALAGQSGDDVLGEAVGEIFLLGIAADVLKRQHSDRRLVGERQRRRTGSAGVGRSLVCGQRRALAIGRRQRRRLAGVIDRSNKTKTPLMERSDQTLIVAVVADRAPRRADPGAERRFRYNAPLPNRLDEFVLGDDPVAVPDEIDEQIEHLRFDADDFPAPAQLLLPEIDLKLGEAKIQSCRSSLRRLPVAWSPSPSHLAHDQNMTRRVPADKARGRAGRLLHLGNLQEITREPQGRPQAACKLVAGLAPTNPPRTAAAAGKRSRFGTPRPQCFRAAATTLEGRTTMAITATFLPGAGTLTTLGDSLDNTIAVMRDAAGTININNGAVAIQGGTPTVVNTSLIQVFGQGGDDMVTLNESNGALPSANLFGGAGDDTLTGGSGADQLFGQGDNDTLFGKGGNDLLLGGDGNDRLTGGAGSDQVFGEAGNDRMIWNAGDGSDLLEGGDGVDTVEVNDGNAAETMLISANGARVRVDRISPAAFSLDIGTTENLVINANGGDDVITAGNGLATLIHLTIDGGAGNDTITGGDGDDTLLGGDGNDLITGGRGSDTALLGTGDDTFVWNPGDGSDVVDGQAGTDTLVFNGANLAEKMDISANGSRVLLTRDVANIVMDLNGVENIQVNALGGADSIVVNDLTGTDAKQVNIDLSA